ncbi:MAG: tetratricopeptide repeat protein [Vicinamibacterales bacterium]
MSARRRRPRSAPGTAQPEAEPSASIAEPAQADRTAGLAWGALLILITVVAYLPSLRNGFIWDDDDYVTKNLVLRSLDGLRQLWLEPRSVPQYYPVTFTSFWLEYRLWGLQPLGYHATNILLHAASALLLWRVLGRIGVAGAWFAAALFAVHPMQVESVAWVTERKNVLSGLFFFAAFLTYLRAEDREAATIRWGPYLGALALFAAAVLSKSTACSLPAVLVLVLWWKRRSLDAQTIWRLIPMFIVGLSMAGTTVWLERYHVGANGPEFQFSALERVLVAGRVLWFYPGTFVWPTTLAFMYPRWAIDTSVWWQYLFPLGAAATIAALFQARERLGEGPLVGALCYAGVLTPALGFINVYPMRYSFVADHFAYLPVVALMVFAAAAGAWILARVPEASRWAAGTLGGAVTLLVLGILTSAHTRAFRDPRTLWTDTLSKNPASWMAHNNLGMLLKEDGKTAEAIAHYVEALRLNPDSPEAHTNYGVVLVGEGQIDEAISHYRAALRTEPRFPDAHHNLGMALESQGQSDTAIEELRAAIRWRPNYVESHHALGILLGRKGQIDDAIAEFTTVVEADPARADGQYNLGVALAMTGKTDQAAARFRETLRLRPLDAKAHHNLGTMLSQSGSLDEAMVHFNRALEIAPEYFDAHNNLGLALRRAGRLDEAIAHFTEAVRLRPTDEGAKGLLRAAVAAREQNSRTSPSPSRN